MSTQPVATRESGSQVDLGEDTPVSNKDITEAEASSIAPSYGKSHQPQPVSMSAFIETVPNYQPLWTSFASRKELTARSLRQARGAEPGIEAMNPPASAETLALDAWYAQFDSPNAAVMSDPKVAAHVIEATRRVAEVVIGQDDRVQIGNTDVYPWSCICALNIVARNNTHWLGTGFLVGPRTVITAGHCLHMQEQGGWVRRIEVIPGADQMQAPFGKSIASGFRSTRGWVTLQKRTHDYGAIILPDTDHLGDDTGTFGLLNLDDDSLHGLTVNLSGYPGDKLLRPTQWFHARMIDDVSDRTILYTIDTAGGQSGAPVWRLENNIRYVVGIHTNGDNSGNSATRIVQPVLDNIRHWIQEGQSQL